MIPYFYWPDMKLLRYITIVCAFLCLFSGHIEAQLANPRATRYTVDQGVSNNIVIEFAQDLDGLLWIATYNGLNRFDGISFRTYRKNYTDANSLHSNMVSRVTVDEVNNIWIGYSDGGVSCFDQATNNFKHYLPDSANPFAILPGTIDEIVVDRQGKVWVGVANHGLMVLDPRTDKFEHIGPLPFVSKLRSPGGQRHYNRLSTILPDSTGMMWLGAGDGFYSFDTHTRAWDDRVPFRQSQHHRRQQHVCRCQHRRPEYHGLQQHLCGQEFRNRQHHRL
jgi:ligand-binding sensor domain-containing protein